ncbi:MAG TPA: formimidoylglutamate deiminase [Albitalea sp.]|uniref:formimidoylglutamate deiminase n=1 Tax=Piscinibacter sp. TaxID=1903157 RepID=UPI002ED5595B
MSALLAPWALLPDGWSRNVLLTWDADGTLTAVTPDAEGATRASGPIVPGVPNLHSHAFQRAFAGLTEYRGGDAADSFWSWRDRMYRFANAVTPEQLEDIATHLYIEMLRAGYTAVCEFHYLHHDAQGRPYADPAEMGLRLAAAAQRAGIGLTLLPVLYQASGFGGQAPTTGQRRFVNGVDALLTIVERLRPTGVRVGVAPHSLRAVTPEALHALVAADAAAPVHIHIAEQQREVDDCLAWSGARPVQWLLDHAEVDARWCLVHATHTTAHERADIARRGAVVGLCPSTEANLGDGVFDAAAYDGAWGIGSDSHASVDVAEELRWLEYGQRLVTRRRNVLAPPQVAQGLWLAAVAGGAQAAGRAIGGLRPGQRADFLVLAGEAGLAPEQQLAAHVFANQPDRTIDEVWVGGQRRVAQDGHALADEARRRFIAARAALLSEV